MPTPMIVSADLPTSSRVHRRPRHKFVIDAFPYCIHPFCLAPVWPGESLVNTWFETREVSPPLKSAIAGWGSEWYLFYVKLSDLIDHPEVMAMLIDPTNAPLTGVSADYTTDGNYYHVGPNPNYLKMCLERVVKTHFRDADEPLVSTTPEAYYLGFWKAKFKDQALFDSIAPEAIDDMAVPAAASGMDDLARAQDLYDYLLAAQLTDLSYSDWCAAYGVKIPAAELNEPELLTQWKEWVYPSNTVDPATGTPSSAISVVVKKNFNEPRYFREPGFLMGCHVMRPKLYCLDQACSSSDFMNTALAWLPAMLSADPSTSIREFTGAQLFGAGAEKYLVDMRDYPLYGDQLLSSSVVADPTVVNMAKEAGLRYPLNADLQALFKVPTALLTRADGFINLDIVGRIVDYSTSHNAPQA